jgi:hypothetical protein
MQLTLTDPKARIARLDRLARAGMGPAPAQGPGPRPQDYCIPWGFAEMATTAMMP